MKIVIIGAGLAGLTTYLHLKKHLPSWATNDITIYERHNDAAPPGPQADSNDGANAPLNASEPTQGGGLGLGSNGMRVLKHLSRDIYDGVVASGFPAEYFEMRSGADKRVARLEFSDGTDVDQCTLMVTWLSLWRQLRRKIPDERVLVVGKKVESVDPAGTVYFEGGEVIEADLIIATDGAHSICRKAVLNDGENGKAEFQNLVSLGGFVPSSQLPGKEACPVMIHGKRGFVAYAQCRGASKDKTVGHGSSDSDTVAMHMWWTTYSADSAVPPVPDSEEAKQKLQYLHGDCPNPVVQYIVHNVSPLLSTPTWVVPKLPRWHRKRLVLLGDAAHALPSTSGQGVSQAFEDAQVLAILLGAALENNKAEKVSEALLDNVAERYQALRKSRVEGIRDEGIRMQQNKKEASALQMAIVNVFMWLGSRFMMSKFRAVQDFDVKCQAEAEAERIRKEPLD